MGNLVIFILSPFVCAIKSIYDFIKGSNSALYVLAICFGTLAYLTAPASDLYTHYLLYESFRNASFSSIFDVDTDFLIPFLDYIFVNLGINYEWIRFLICSIQFCTLAYLFCSLTQDYYQKEKITLFLIVLLYTNFYGTFVGVRGPLSISFFILGILFRFIDKKKIKSYLFFALAAISHFFMIPVIAFTLFISCFKKFHISNLVFLLSLGICYFVGATLSEYFVLQFFPEEIGYINGYWGNEHIYTFKGYIFVIITRYAIIPLIYFFLKNNDGNDSYRNVLLFFICCFALTASFDTISSRFLPIIRYMSLIFFLTNYHLCSKRIIRIVLCFGIILQASTLYTNRDFLLKGNNNYPAFFQPAILTFDNTFSNSWINKHIESDGLFRNTSH